MAPKKTTSKKTSTSKTNDENELFKILSEDDLNK